MLFNAFDVGQQYAAGSQLHCCCRPSQHACTAGIAQLYTITAGKVAQVLRRFWRAACATHA